MFSIWIIDYFQLLLINRDENSNNKELPYESDNFRQSKLNHLFYLLFYLSNNNSLSFGWYKIKGFWTDSLASILCYFRPNNHLPTLICYSSSYLKASSSIARKITILADGRLTKDSLSKFVKLQQLTKLRESAHLLFLNLRLYQSSQYKAKYTK